MRSLGPTTIATARLTLRPLVESDADEMVHVLGDVRMHEFTGGVPLALDELSARYRQLVVGRAPDGRELWLNWIVRTSTGGEAVGAMQATVSIDGTAAEVAWEIGVPWQGRGFASEAAAAVVSWLAARDVRRIEAHVHPDHHASASVAARAGLSRTDGVIDGEVVWLRLAQPDGG